MFTVQLGAFEAREDICFVHSNAAAAAHTVHGSVFILLYASGTCCSSAVLQCYSVTNSVTTKKPIEFNTKRQFDRGYGQLQGCGLLCAAGAEARIC
jgi:hypothetical protein